MKSMKRLLAGLLLAALTLALLPPVQAAEAPEEQWDEERIYPISVAFASETDGVPGKGSYRQAGVRVIDGYMMADVFWLCEELDLPYSCDTCTSFTPGDLWSQYDPEGEAARRSNGKVMTFQLQKEAGSMRKLFFASGLDEVILFAAPAGLYTMEWATPPVWDGETEHLWVPLSDILFLIDASSTYDGTGLVIFPPELTVLDLACRPTSRINDYFCDAIAESGMDDKRAARTLRYRQVYNAIKGTLKSGAKLDLKGVHDALSENKHMEELGQQLAYEMCTVSQQEHDKLVERSAWFGTYYDANGVLMDVIKGSLAEGAGETLGEAERVLGELTDQLARPASKGDRELVAMLQSQNKKVANLGNDKVWLDRLDVGLTLELSAVEQLFNAFVTCSNLEYEVGSADKQTVQFVQTFLDYNKKNGADAMTEPQLLGLQERVKKYKTSGVNLGSTEYIDVVCELLSNSASSVGGTLATLAASKAMSALLLKLQVISIGWDALEILVNHVTGGVFDMFDCLYTGVGGILLETDAEAVLRSYIGQMAFTGSMTDPVFDWDTLETYRQLLWTFLKACYVTRSNAIGTWDSEKENDLYEIALGPLFRKNKLILEEMTAAANGPLGPTPEQMEAHKEGLELENEYELKAIRNILNNGGNYVQVGQDVYFWLVDEEAYSTEAMFGGFYPLTYGFTTNASLVCRAPDGTITELCRELIDLNPNLYVCGGNIYYTSYEDGDSWYHNWVSVVPLEGGTPRRLFRGSVVGLDEATGQLVCKQFGADEKEALYLFDPEDESGVQLYGECNVLEIYNGYVYFQIDNPAQDTVGPCLRANLNTGEVEELCTPALMDDWPNGYLASYSDSMYQFEIFDDYAYFSCGYIEGSGLFFQGGFIARVRLDGTGYEWLAGDGDEYAGGSFQLRREDGDVVLSYCVGDGVYESLYDPDIKPLEPNRAINLTTGGTAAPAEDACPRGRPFFYNGDVAVYDGEGEMQVLLEPEDYAFLGYGAYWTDESAQLTDVEQVGNSVWFVLHGAVHDPALDFGWRVRYRREASYLCCKDLTTGETVVVNEF